LKNCFPLIVYLHLLNLGEICAYFQGAKSAKFPHKHRAKIIRI
jgi:hypothetical protein